MANIDNVINVPSQLENEDFSLDVLHQDQGTYHIYNEYMQTIDRYVLNKVNSLSIRYYKTNILKSDGVDTELKLINGKRFGVTYDIFDMVQVIQSQPLTYTNEMDDSNHVMRKTYGTITTHGLNNPLPGDIFHFYPNGVDQTEDDIEFFVIDNINFIKSASGSKIFQLEFSTANVKVSSIKNFNIENHYYFLKEFRKFFSKDIYIDYQQLLEHRNDYIDIINKNYEYRKCKYFLLDTDMNNKLFTIINTIIYNLNSKYDLSFHPVLLDYDKELYKNIDEYINDYIPADEINKLNIEDKNFLDNLSNIQGIYDRLENFKFDDFKKIGSDVEESNAEIQDLDKEIVNV